MKAPFQIGIQYREAACGKASLSCAWLALLPCILGEERSDPEGQQISLFPQMPIDLWAGFGFVLVCFSHTHTGLGLDLYYRIFGGRIW